MYADNMNHLRMYTESNMIVCVAVTKLIVTGVDTVTFRLLHAMENPEYFITDVVMNAPIVPQLPLLARDASTTNERLLAMRSAASVDCNTIPQRYSL
ncbi:hypothetical protein Z517_09317 [Fonsecaea pedrosoi CBS 271.37]|uniref:Unplaced genomic scaffold supercont1.6, whole genome shotgun sequence n=1 Tax=Fonsecaea pedrosoi CBS 271.37 TaxID=1442368 RepID=A0A0D2G858_9EURO|nr:uncharacterized protein Z517_09317 [Fonsecaea pedrosoi CBS 271.37]KIW76873.1 hypothetical protein Z517_09317 [Fonsecaea pedrosoi CBS 271.37]